MANRSIYFLCVLGVTALLFATYEVSLGADAKTPGPINYITHFNGKTCLVVLDLGTDGVDRTVLVNAMITDIGGKHFLGGVVTDEFKEFRVVSSGTTAYVPLDRIAYIQILDSPNTNNKK